MLPIGRLLVVGLTPPATSGARTRARVNTARQLLGFATVDLVNLFAFTTHDATDLSVAGQQSDGWHAARPVLGAGLENADGVLLAYGVQLPTGLARTHFRSQVDWLERRLVEVDLPVWLVGGAPRHPSRWQRYTHRTAPELPFEQALHLALRLREATPAPAPAQETHVPT